MASGISFKSILIFQWFVFAAVLAGMMAETTDTEAYNCWVYINCISEDAEELKGLETCLDVLDKKDIDTVTKSKSIRKEAYNVTDYPTLYEAMDKTYCPLDSTKRKEIFYSIGEKAYDIASVGCKLRYPRSTCDHYSYALDCMLDFISALSAAGKCDIGSFDD